MRSLIVRALPLALGLLVAACSTPKPLPKYQKPLARTAIQTVRTTAYTHTEDDHVAYGAKSALGTTLSCGPIHSAAADWSRWPAGTVFRIRETGEIYKVDDYGWALAGTNTIDLYKPSRAAMNAWGVRTVTIENLQWGDPRRSLAVLHPREKYRHIRRMVDQLEDRLASWSGPQPTVGPDPAQFVAPAPLQTPSQIQPSSQVASRAPVAEPIRLAQAVPVARAVPVAQPVGYSSSPRPASAATPRSGVARDPFFVNTAR